MKISSSARLSLRERRISAAAATRATRSITGVSKKSARQRQLKLVRREILERTLSQGKLNRRFSPAFADV